MIRYCCEINDFTNEYSLSKKQRKKSENYNVLNYWVDCRKLLNSSDQENCIDNFYSALTSS